MKGKDTLIPLFDFQEKQRIGVKPVKVSSSGVVGPQSNTLFYK